MAKSSIGRGQFSGKLGGDVYAVRNGQQIIRAYQPIVSNPKSVSQNIQRAKGNLVGRISKITPWQILEGLGTNKYNRRSRLLRLLLNKVTAGQAAGDPSVFNAKLADIDFVFSEGALIPLHRVVYGSALESVLNVTVSTAEGISATLAASQGVLVVAVIKQSSSVWEEVVYRFVSPEELSSGTLAIEFHHRSEGAYTASIYYAPFGTADGSKLPTRTGDLTSSASSLDALLAVGTSASSVVWGMSTFWSVVSFTPTT